MFEPNLVGRLMKPVSRNVHAEVVYGEPIQCPFGVVNMHIGAQKTSVRADSSASRGSADEMMAERAKILVPAYVDIQIGDRFECDEGFFMVAARHVRRSVLGTIDHYECDLETLPE